MKIVFHALSGGEFGSGHVIRCLNLAKILQKGKDLKIFFVTNQAGQCIIGQKFKTVVLKNEYSFHDVQTIFKMLDPDMIIYDILDVQEEYIDQTSVNNAIKIVFDYYNRQRRLTSADIVFNFHVRPGMVDTVDADFYEGLEFAILGEDFYSTVPKQVKWRDDCHVLVSFGSTDANNITMKVVNALLAYERVPLILHVVVGSGYQQKDFSKSFSMHRKHLKIYQNVRNMATLMSSMDLAFVGGGVTLLEIIQMKIPAVAICAHQYGAELASNLQGKGCLINLGLYDRVSVRTIHKNLDSLLLENQYDVVKTKLYDIHINGTVRIRDILYDKLCLEWRICHEHRFSN